MELWRDASLNGLVPINGRNEWVSWTPDGPSGDTCTRTTTSGLPNALEETCGTNPTVSYQRDANGNLADDGSLVYHWDFLNRLVRVEDKASGDLVVGYAYDAFDRRIVKVFPGQTVSVSPVPPQQGDEEAWYTWSGQQIVQESRPVDTFTPSTGPVNVHVIRQWTYGPRVDEVLEMSTDVDGDQITTGSLDVRHYYHMDALNTVIGLTDESGDLVEGYSYEPYGDVVTRTPGASFDDVRWNADDATETLLEFGRQAARKSDECRDATRWAPPGNQRVTVLGHYPSNAAEAGRTGTRSMDVPDAVWRNMDSGQRLATNQRFLDNAIQRDDVFRLSTRVDDVRPDIFFAWELDCLAAKGFRPSADGLAVVRGGFP